jgi:hypothetical protein
MRTLMTLPLLALVGACATPPDTPESRASLDCSDRRPVTGSSIARKDPCFVAVDRGQNAARSQAEAIQEELNLRNPPKTGN